MYKIEILVSDKEAAEEIVETLLSDNSSEEDVIAMAFFPAEASEEDFAWDSEEDWDV